MKALLLIIVMIPELLSGQLVFTFEENSLDNWIQQPNNRWSISSDQPVQGNFTVQHSFDNTENGTDYIGRSFDYPDLSDTLVFTFRIRHAYNPSSGNNWQIFLLSDVIPDGNDLLNGLFFGVNLIGSDDTVRLWQILNGEPVEIGATDINFQEEIGTTEMPLFKLIRFPDGSWSMYCSISGKEKLLRKIGTGKEDAPQCGKYAGFRYQYTSAQDRKLWIDSIAVQGRFERDTIAPSVDSVTLNELSTMQLHFQEAVRIGSGTSISLSANALDTVWVYRNILMARFLKKFPMRTPMKLFVQNVYDLENNRMSDTLINMELDLPEFGDVVITELMPDPDPPVYLPACEYIELFNQLDRKVDLSGWFIVINDRKFQIENQLLNAGEYAVYTSIESECIYAGVNSLPLFSSNTAIPNRGGMIRLYDLYGCLIHFLEYEDISNYNKGSGEGGISIECIDPSNLCGGRQNWSLSTSDLGGTPGEMNSASGTFPDRKAASHLYLGIPEEELLLIEFDEPVQMDADSLSQYLLNGRQVYPMLDSFNAISSSVILEIPQGLKHQVEYTIEMKNIFDCSGNSQAIISRDFRRPSHPSPGEIVLNEVMYDPLEECNEYIELFNNGDVYYDLYDLKLGISKEINQDVIAAYITNESHLLAPGAFVVLCEDRIRLIEEWIIDSGIDIVECDQWRSLPNEKGYIDLLDRAENRIDRFAYSDILHSDLLGITSGVALERITHNPCAELIQCWNSASFADNYGTPGIVNSQNIESSTIKLKPELSPKVFSPDLDGFEDVLELTIPALNDEKLLSMFVTDLNGRLVRTLASGVIGGMNNRFYWDGTGNDKRIVQPGLYIVHIRISGRKGDKIFREICAVKYRDFL
ncbi:lamin tail domain-containing protein [Bacteroidota bacterium]